MSLIRRLLKHREWMAIATLLAVILAAVGVILNAVSVIIGLLPTSEERISLVREHAGELLLSLLLLCLLTLHLLTKAALSGIEKVLPRIKAVLVGIRLALSKTGARASNFNERLSEIQGMSWELEADLSKTEVMLSEVGKVLSRLSERVSKLSQTRTRLSGVLDSMFSWSLVPAGPFRSRDRFNTDIDRNCPSFSISAHLVTNEQYKMFIDQANYERVPIHWERGNYPKGKRRHPVVGVSRVDAESYCSWLSELTGKTYRLPDEYEWEKSARGTDGREYPWGNEFDELKCNSAESGIEDTTSVDEYENGKSPYGCYDMVGNVSEWTASTENTYAAVVRGSSYTHEKKHSHCCFGFTYDPRDGTDFIGFRIVKGPH
jgi:hypothetical protein